MSFDSGGSGSSIAASSDVLLSNATTGDLFVYESSVAKWENKAPATGTVTPDVVSAPTNSGSSYAIPAPSSQTITRLTLTANCTVTFPAAVSGSSFTVVLTQDSTGARTVTWPGTVRWPNASAPTLTGSPSSIDLVSFLSVDGTTWLGMPGGHNFA